MEQLGTDFNATGSVMSRAELEDQRRKRGECVTCGRKCFQKKLFKMIPITDHGRVLNGRCLNCNPLDASDGALPAVSRPATQADLARFTRSQNNLRSQGAGSGAPTSAQNEPEQRRRASHADTRPSSRRSSRRTDAHSARSLTRHSVSSGASLGSCGGSHESSTESSSHRGAIGAHITGRSMESIQSAPAIVGSRGQSSGSIPPGSASSRPSMSRPNSNRSISASSYYSSRSRTSVDSSASRDEGEPRRGQNACYDEDESEDYDDYNGHLQDDDTHDLPEDYSRGYDEETYDESVSVEPASLDYYQRSYHDRDYSSRSLRSTDSHESGISREGGYRRDSIVDRGGDVQCDDGEYEPDQMGSGASRPPRGRRGEEPAKRRSVTLPNDERIQRRSSIDSMGGGSYSGPPSRAHSLDGYREHQHQPPIISDHMSTDGGGGRRGSGERREVSGSSRSLDSGLVAFDNEGQRHLVYRHTSSPDLQSLNENEVNVGQFSSTRSDESLDGNDELDLALQRLRGAGNDIVGIIKCMRDYQNSVDVQACAIQKISNIELADEDCATLADNGAIQLFIDAMDAFNEDLELQVYGCRAIWKASGTPENQRAFVKCGALGLILQAMSSFAENAELQEHALLVLTSLGGMEDNLDMMHESGTVERLVMAMNKHASNAQVQMKGCLTIANLASHPTSFNEKLISAGAGSAVVISMVMHPGDSELQEKALRALRNLSADCDENRVELTNIGGIDAIISAMQVHRDVAGVQEAGAWTLSNLATNADSKVLIGDCGGIDVIVRAMWVHSDKVSVQEWCCRALYSLSSDLHNSKIILGVGGIAAIINAMQAYVDAVGVQEMGCAVLCNLASDQQSKMRIVDEEALDAVVLAMVLFGDDRKVQERSCQLLLQLSIAENFKAMQASNVGELVRSAAHKFPDSCADPAERLIHVIEGYISDYL